MNGVVLGKGLVPFASGGTRYVIEAAKSGRSTCTKSFRGIPKGALRWTCYQNGVQRGGWTLLEFVTPKMLHNAIVAHKSIDKIHGFENVDGKQAIEVMEILRDIARTGGKAPKGKKKAKKGKGRKKKEDNDDDDVDEGVLEMAVLTLDERLEQALQAAKQAGDVLMIDCSDDEEDVAPPPPPKEVVMEKVPVPTITADDDDDDFDDDEYSDEDEDEDEEVNAAEHPDRAPEDGDTIFMTWDADPTEYLCVVHDSEDKKGGLEVTSADAKFTETLDFDPASDLWRFSEGNVKNISNKARSNKGKKKVAANPNMVKSAASKIGEDGGDSGVEGG